MFITEKFLPFILTVLLVFSLMIGCSSNQPGDPNNPGGNVPAGQMKLKDIYVFYNNGENLSAKTSNLDPSWQHTWNPGNSFVQDNGETNSLNSSRRVYKVSKDGQIMFPLHGWGAFSLEQYYANGVIEFDLRLSNSGTNFKVGLRSDTKNNVVTQSVNISKYAQSSSSWQHVKVTIKDIVDKPDDPASKNPLFSIGNILLIEMNNVPSAGAFYISDMKISSPDAEKQFPIIKINQDGYRPNDIKYALVSYFPGTFNISTNTEFKVVKKDGAIKHTGKLTLVTNSDPTSGEKIFRADFSALKETGEYHISVSAPGVNDSYNFSIKTDVYDKLLVDSIRYFYFQRQGINLTAQYAGDFARNNLHPGDSTVKKLSERNNGGAPTYDLSHGWYDAGDFGKYLLPAATTVSDLLFAYETFPSLFADNQLNIPESGNGAPDFLDEIKWELDMMLKFEDGTSGGFWHVANYSKFNNVDTIFIVDTDNNGTANTKSSSATAAAAGVLAHAYLVYKDIPSYVTFANQCLDAAKRAWTYMENNPGNKWVNDAVAPRNYQEADQTVNIMRFWAACALYRATGEAKYNTYVTSNYNKDSSFAVDGKPRFNSSQVLSNGSMAAAFIHYAKSASPNSAVVTYFKNQFTNFQNGIFGYYNQKNWPTMLVDWGYWWGSNDPICRSPAELYLCSKVLNLDTTKSVELVRDSVHYILGINPMSFSFVSGHGENCVQNIFSGIYTYHYDKDKGYAIPPGYMAGGSSMYDLAFSSNWGSKSYVDSDREWTTNENGIYWNAALVLLLTINKGTAP